MKIQIVFESFRLRLAFWGMLIALIALGIALTLESMAAGKDGASPVTAPAISAPAASKDLSPTSAKLPELPDELRERFGLQANNSAGKMLLVDFYSDYCGVCRIMEPHLRMLKRLANEKVHFERLDLGKPGNHQYLKLYEMEGTPTYILFNQDGQPVYRMYDRISPVVLTQQVLRFSGQLTKVEPPAAVLAQALTDKNPLTLVAFGNQECADCRKGEGYLSAFSMANADNLSVITLDSDQPEIRAFMKKINVKTVPAYIVIDQENQLLFRMEGTLNTPERAKGFWDMLQGFNETGI